MEKVKENLAVYNDTVTEKSNTKFFSIQQTVDMPENHRLTIELPREIPAGKVHLEVKVIPFADKQNKPDNNGKLSLSRKELDEILKDCPITQRLSGILSDVGDINLDEIRMARLAKHL